MRAPLRLIAALWIAPALAAAQAPAPPLDMAVQREAVQTAAALLRQNYVFPDVGAAAADRIVQAQAAGDYAGVLDPAAFGRRVTQDLLAATHDKHVAMIARVDGPLESQRPRTNGGFSRVERLKGNIGYARLDLFPPLGVFRPFADQAMKALADTDALIVDLRGNGGGSAASATYFASAFFDPATPVHLEDLVNRMPGTAETTTTALRTVPTPAPYLGKAVYILAGPDSFSAAEEFADGLKAQGRAVVVGEPTGGGANPGVSWPLVGGRLRVFIPSSRARDPATGANWEGAGVAPDVAAPAPQALSVALDRIVAGLDAAGGGPRLAPLKARLKPGVAVEPLVDAHLLALRDKAQPGSETALRKLIADLAAGRPDYAAMDSDIAAATRRMQAGMQADLTRLGAIKSVTFRGVGVVGGDEFDVQFANGAAVWMIYRLEDGRLAAFGVSLGER